MAYKTIYSTLYHDKIKLSSEMDIGHPNWATAFTLPNHAEISEIRDICINEAKVRKQK
jgi:hypothetical protein